MKKLLGGILLAIGVLIAGASGLCSITFVAIGFSDPGGAAQTLPLVLIFGGIPFAIGSGLFYAGRRLIKAAREDSGEDL